MLLVEEGCSKPLSVSACLDEGTPNCHACVSERHKIRPPLLLSLRILLRLATLRFPWDQGAKGEGRPSLVADVLTGSASWRGQRDMGIGQGSRAAWSLNSKRQRNNGAFAWCGYFSQRKKDRELGRRRLLISKYPMQILCIRWQ